MEAHESFVEKNPKARQHYLDLHLSNARTYLKLIEEFLEVQSSDTSSCYCIEEGTLEKKGKRVQNGGTSYKPIEVIGSGNYLVRKQFSSPWNEEYYIDTVRERMDLAMFTREALVDYVMILQAEKDGYEFPANGLLPLVTLFTAEQAERLLKAMPGIKKSHEEGLTSRVRIRNVRALLPNPSTADMYDTVYQALFQRYHNVMV